MLTQIGRLTIVLSVPVIFFNTGCKKTDFARPPEQAHFLNTSPGTFFVLDPASTFKIPVGVTTVSNVDRTFSFSVSSPTGAVAGTHYIVDNSFTIPAGKALDSIEVKGVFDQYASGRKDTLVFTIEEGSGKSSDYNSQYTLLVRGTCFEGDVDLNNLLGTYAKTVETFGTAAPYGPYTTTITSVTSTGPTTGTIVVNNIWDNGWGPITFDLDWTDPANRTVTVEAMDAIPGSDGGDLNSAYAGETIAVRPFAGKPGTFSSCNGTLTLNMQLGITNLGYFSALYQVKLAK